MATTSQGSKVNNSLVWKLAFAQVRRILSVCMRIDFWIVLLCLASFIYYGEWQGKMAAMEIPQIIEQMEAPDSFYRGNTDYSITNLPKGISASTSLERAGVVPTGSYRTVAYAHSPIREKHPNSSDWILNIFPDKVPLYKVYLPLENQQFLVITQDFSHGVSIVLTCFILILLIQAFTILSNVWKAQRNITRTLRPLYELTSAAQSMSADMTAPLSSTIDALDTITENHLDRRISISDERAELQGLASAINNMLDRLDASYQAQLRFVSDASHELRTPIAIIQGYASLLERWGKDDPETLNESILAIKSEAIGMQLLVEQLLFLARSDNQSIVIKKQNIDLSGLLEEVVKETEMINDTHVFTSHVEPDLWVMGDPQLLKQSIRVLVDNSIKYTPEKGVITINASMENRQIVISVTDTGIGMTAEEVEHIFERFWRADEARNRKSGGTGLGLSIAKWIVDSHQGHLEVSSRKNLGTKTSIVLPNVAQKQPRLRVNVTKTRHAVIEICLLNEHYFPYIIAATN